jgi:hypothetical protein
MYNKEIRLLQAGSVTRKLFLQIRIFDWMKVLDMQVLVANGGCISFKGQF